MSEIQCPACDGYGEIPLGVHYVSHEMAMDAGQPEMEGSVAEVEYGPCSRCRGTGTLEASELPSGGGTGRKTTRNRTKHQHLDASSDNSEQGKGER